MGDTTSSLPRRTSRFLPVWAGLWARDSALLILSQGLTVLATTVAAILIARTLDPAEWGVFSAFLGVSFALAVFVEFGLATWLLRELSRMFEERGESAVTDARGLVGTSMTSALGVTGVIVLLGAGLSLVLGERPAVVVALTTILLYGGLFASANVLEAFLRARRRLRRVVAASILEKYLLLVLLTVIAVSGTSVWAIGVAYAIAGTLRLFLLGAGVFGRSVPRIAGAGQMRAVWRKSLPFALSTGAITVIPMLDVLVLLALSATAAGYFALGVRVLGPALVVAAVGATTLYPFLAKRVHWRGSMWALAAGFGVVGGVLAVLGIAIAPTVIPAIFGEQYRPAVPAVRVMLVSLPFIYAASPLLTYSFSSGRERAVVCITAAAATFGTAAIVVGQLLVGVTGAATGATLRSVLLFSALAWIAHNAEHPRHADQRGVPAPLLEPPLT